MLLKKANVFSVNPGFFSWNCIVCTWEFDLKAFHQWDRKDRKGGAEKNVFPLQQQATLEQSIHVPHPGFAGLTVATPPAPPPPTPPSLFFWTVMSVQFRRHDRDRGRPKPSPLPYLFTAALTIKGKAYKPKRGRMVHDNPWPVPFGKQSLAPLPLSGVVREELPDESHQAVIES